MVGNRAMVQTIDITSGVAHVIRFSSWGEVSRHYRVHPKTIRRDREALGRYDEPINPDLLGMIAKMRRCIEMGGISRRTVIRWHLEGCLDQKIEEFEPLRFS